jgi:ABC-type Fe3+ transport system substrate-binding protein
MAIERQLKKRSKRTSALHCNFIAVLFFLIPQPALLFAAEPWQAEWEKVLAAAKRDGRVVVAGPTGNTHRQVLAAAFEKSYPEIRVEYTGALLREMVPRMVQERQAGLYLWDIFIGVSVNAVAPLKAVGAFDSLRPALTRPEALDDSKWRKGFQDGFMDADGRLYYAFDGTVGRTMHVNWDAIPRGEVRSPQELLDPKWAGKIVWDDPRQPGAGRMAGVTLMLAYGEDFLLRLWREQKVTYTADRRQLADWVVRGRYPIALGLAVDFLANFQQEGVGRAVEALEATSLDTISPGFGSLVLMNRAPHQNAAKVYANWLLSREAQREWAEKTQRNSRRLDVPPGDPSRAPKPGVNYLETLKEAMEPKAERVLKLAREHIR